MPSFSHSDRLVLDLEYRLWVCASTLDDIPDCFWTKRVNEIRASVIEIAREIRDHNDQFETEED